jgi:general secretion pathway protein K
LRYDVQSGRRPAGRRKQQGVALIIALILVALATILATKLSFDGWLERRRTLGVLAAEQAVHFGLGAEALAADVLGQSPNTQSVTLNQPWAQSTQPLPLTPPDDPEGEPIGSLQGSLEDLQGRFNLNNLAYVKASAAGTTPPIGATTQFDPEPLEQFKRLLRSVGLEDKWAGIARDWITATDVPSSPDGAKDSIYTGQNPPYRTGMYPMMSASELMNLPGFGADRYRKIAPYVTALPENNVKINICTASAFVLESLANNLNGEWSRSPDLLVSERKTGCFPTTAAFQTIVKGADPKAFADLAQWSGEQSRYFRLTTRVNLGTTEFTLYSLLKVGGGGGGKVTPLLRTFGTP